MKERDAINGVTPDVLVFFAGSSGTLCELAFALQAKRPVLFWRAAQILRNKYEEHTADGEVDGFLAAALSACRTKLGSVFQESKAKPLCLRFVGHYFPDWLRRRTFQAASTTWSLSLFGWSANPWARLAFPASGTS